MAALPENWEWDYDGQRWFYRYKPTGLIQYTFPKPGDEFPEFVGDGPARVDLAPEEKLVSQKQLRRRSTLGESSSNSAAVTTQKQTSVTQRIDEQDEGADQFWLQPDGLMYMGPGAYTDISPLQENEEEEEASLGPSKASENTDVARTDTEASTIAAAGGSPKQDTSQPTKPHAPPIVSAETTPLVTNSQPAVTSPETSSVIAVETIEIAPVDSTAAPSPTVPLLDSREVEVPRDPLGFVAELPSELTARCHEEIHPTPVELPGHEIMVDVPTPAVYANAFSLDPVELPSDSVTATQALAKETERPGTNRGTQDPLHRPNRPLRQNSLPQPPSGQMPGKYQPYNPARHGAGSEHKPTLTSNGQYAIAAIRDSELAGGSKRHSLAGPAPMHHQSEIPASLRPPQVPPKVPLGGVSNDSWATASVNRTRHESLSGTVKAADSGELGKFPSVLKPARGRPVLARPSPPQSRPDSPKKDYQAYRPYRDLQKDIEDTVQLLSKTSYARGTTTPPETSNSSKPQTTRTGALPSYLPTVPYMGDNEGSQLAFSGPSASSSSQHPRVPIASCQSHDNSNPPGREASTPAFQEYSTPLPPSSPDLPQPLKLSRKSPEPANRNSVPTVNASLRPSIATEQPEPVSQEPAPALSDTMRVTVPGKANPATEADPEHESSDLNAQLSACDQAAPTVQPDQRIISGNSQVELHEIQASEPVSTESVTSPGQSQPAVARFEQAESSEPCVVLEPTISSASPPARAPIDSGVNNKPTLTSSFAVESIDVAPASTGTSKDYREPQKADASLDPRNEMPSETSVDAGQGTSSNQVPVPTPSGFVPEEFPKPGTPQPGVAVPAVTIQLSSPQVTLDLPPVETQGSQDYTQPMRRESVTLCTSHAPQPDTSNPPSSKPAAPETLTRPPLLSSQQLAAQQAVTPPPPQPSLTPLPRTPSPLSRTSSPPAHGSISGAISRNPSVAAASSAPNPRPESGASPNQDPSNPSVTRPGPSPSQLPTSNLPMTSRSQAPVQTIPDGHHPLGSHHVNVSPPSPPKLTRPDHQGPDKPGVGHWQPWYSTRDSAAAGTANQQQHPALGIPTHSQHPPLSGPPPSFAQQTPTSSPGSVANLGPTGQPSAPQPLPVNVPVQTSMHSAGQVPPMPMAPGQGPIMANVPNSVPPGAPHRSFSVASPPSASSHAIRVSGTAPPQRPVVFAPPGLPQAMPAAQAVQLGIPSRQTFPGQPGMLAPQASMPTHLPTPPQMMQPNQGMGAPHAIQMQLPQSVSPVKEEKGWFGRLWRSDTVKRSNSAAGNKLQKQGARPMPQQSYSQGQADPGMQFANQPMFAPPGAQQGMAPQMMVHHPHPDVLQHPQPSPNMQQKSYFQPQPPPQFQPGIATNNGNGNMGMPKYESPVSSQPHMYQASVTAPQQQHPQQIQMQRQSMGGGGGSIQMPPQQQVQGVRTGSGPYFAAGGHNGAVGSGSSPANTGTGKQTGNSNTKPSSAGWGTTRTSAYDGAGWGDDFDEDYK